MGLVTAELRAEWNTGGSGSARFRVIGGRWIASSPRRCLRVASRPLPLGPGESTTAGPGVGAVPDVVVPSSPWWTLPSRGGAKVRLLSEHHQDGC